MVLLVLGTISVVAGLISTFVGITTFLFSILRFIA